jgi:predicted NodU family carbamoyl transferase
VVDGKILAAAQEERFSRKKFDSGFPAESIRFCLAQANPLCSKYCLELLSQQLAR